MPGTMSEADLVADLKASMGNTSSVFVAAADADFKRFLAQALGDMQVKRPITKLGSVTLAPGEPSYALAAADFARLKFDLWRDPAKLGKPWSPGYAGPLPKLCAHWDGAGWSLAFDPAPNERLIGLLGAECKFWYFAKHQIGAEAAATTVNPQDRGLLLLRAQVEAMRELAVRNTNKPVQLRDGLSGTPRNSTPAALHEVLMRLFWEWR